MIAALVAGSVGSVALAALMLLMNEQGLLRFSTYLTYLAGGTLLGASMLGMIPKAVGSLGPQPAMMMVLAGILFSFCSKKSSSGEAATAKTAKDMIMQLFRSS